MVNILRSAPTMQLGAGTLALAVSLLGTANAQAPAAAAPPSFRSALDGYQSYQDQPTADWRKVNAEVGAIGGWREYARQASETGTPTSESGKGTDSATGTTPPAKSEPGRAASEKAKP